MKRCCLYGALFTEINTFILAVAEPLVVHDVTNVKLVFPACEWGEKNIESVLEVRFLSSWQSIVSSFPCQVNFITVDDNLLFIRI